MATIRQKIAFSKTLENIGNPGKGKPVKSKKQILKESGYSAAIAKNPEFVYESKFFHEELSKINDFEIVKLWHKWALSDSDKRVAVQCGENIMKLKSRFPKEAFDIELSRKREALVDPD